MPVLQIMHVHDSASLESQAGQLRSDQITPPHISLGCRQSIMPGQKATRACHATPRPVKPPAPVPLPLQCVLHAGVCTSDPGV